MARFVCMLVLLTAPVLLAAEPASTKPPEAASKSDERAPRCVAASGDDEKPARATQPVSPFMAASARCRPPAAKSEVITNEDLAKVTPGIGWNEVQGNPTAPLDPAAAEADATADPLGWLEKQQSDEARHKEAVAEAERHVTQAQKRVNDLAQLARQSRNPFGPRPGSPDGADKGWDSLSELERRERHASALKEAEQRLEEANARLAELKTRG